MSTRAERIDQAIKASGLNHSEVARRIGCKPAAVSQWVSGSTKNLRNEYLFALADLTGFEARWIAIGEGPVTQAEARDEAKLLENYRAAGEERRDIIRRVAEPAPPYKTGNDR